MLLQIHIPNAFTNGDTYDEAIFNAREVLDLMLLYPLHLKMRDFNVRIARDLNFLIMKTIPGFHPSGCFAFKFVPDKFVRKIAGILRQSFEPLYYRWSKEERFKGDAR